MSQDVTERKDELQEGMIHYQAAHRGRVAGDEDEQNCNFGDALLKYDDAQGEARLGIACAQHAEHEDPTKANTAAYIEAINSYELGASLKRFNDVVTNRPAPGRKIRGGGAEAYCSVVAELDRAASLGGIKSEVLAVFAFFRGCALVGTNQLKEGTTELQKFIDANEAGSGFLVEARATQKGALDTLTSNARKDEAPTLDNEITGAPRKQTNKFADCKASLPAPNVPSATVISITSGIGYDDNVGRLSRTGILPVNITSKGAFYNDSNLVASGTWYPNVRAVPGNDPDDILADCFTLGYQIDGAEYDDHDSYNSLAQAVTANYAHALTADWSAGVIVSNTWVRSDNRNVSDTSVLRPYQQYQLCPALSTTVFYSTNYVKDLLRGVSQARTDGFTHILSVQFALVVLRGAENPTPSLWKMGLPTGQLTITPSFQHEWTLSRGILADRQRDDPAVKVELVLMKSVDTCSFIRSVSVTGTYEFRDDRYTNATAPKFTASNPYHRHDESSYLDFAFSTKVWYDEIAKNRLELIFDYKITKQNSNVAARAFDDSLFLSSLKFNF